MREGSESATWRNVIKIKARTDLFGVEGVLVCPGTGRLALVRRKRGIERNEDRTELLHCYRLQDVHRIGPVCNSVAV
jgi:hypothetical protein